MFREGTCPKCREKIQVPDDREKIICMFCGQEIRVDEALGNTKKSPMLGEGAMEEAKTGLSEVIRNCDNPMQDFKKDKYEGKFEDYYARHRTLFESMQLVYEEAEDPGSALKELAGHLAAEARAALDAIKSKGRRNQQQMDYNFLLSVYLIPSMLKYPASFSEPFTDCLVETWNREFETSIGKAGYAEISGGFRKKLCYITTAVCENLGEGEACRELAILKGFRDHYLEATPEGHALVEEYYNIAPTIVKRMNRQPEHEKLYRELYEDYLLPCVCEIERQEYEACKARYQKMVLELKARYIS